jgi:hypothetical protein
MVLVTQGIEVPALEWIINWDSRLAGTVKRESPVH